MARTFDVTYGGRAVDVSVPDDYTDAQISAVLRQVSEKLKAEAGAEEPKKPGKVDQAWQDDMAELGGIATRGIVRGVAPVAAGVAAGAPFGPPGMIIGGIAGGFAEPIADAAAWGFNKLRSKKDYKAPSAYVDDALDTVFPHPDTTGERMLETGAGALTSTAGSLRALGTAAARAAPGTFRNVANWLRANPGSQMVSAPIAAATAQGVGEATDSPLLGAAAGIATGTASNARLPPRLRNVPTRDQVRNEATRLYNEAENAGVLVDSQYLQGRLGVIRARLERDGFVPELQPRVDAALRTVERRAATGQNRSLQDLETDRRILRNAIDDLDPASERAQMRIGNRAIDNFDDYVNRLGQGRGLVAGDADVAVPALQQARQMYRRSATADEVERIMEKARNQASGFSQSGMDNAVRTQFKIIADNPRRMRQFSRVEQAAILRIVRGEPLQNVLRYLGKFSPRGVVSAGISAALGGVMAGPAGVAAMFGAGEAAREASARLRVRRANDLQDMVLSGRQPQNTVLGVRQPQGPLRAALEATRATDNEEDEPAGAGFAAGGLVDADDFASGIMINEGRRNGR